MSSAIVITLFLSAANIVLGRSLELLPIPNGITIHKVVRTWKEADLLCKAEGAVLASPISTELLNAMRTLIAINNTPYFIGTRSSNFSAPFTSLEGVPLDNMTAAVTQMIQQLDPRDGDCLSMDQHSIRVVPCCARLPYLCYRAQIEHTSNNEVTTENLNGDRKACPRDYTYYESTGSCYKIHRDLKNWDDAQATCVAEGGYLAVLDNSKEAQTIDNMDIQHEYPATHLGLRDFEENNVWTSVNGNHVEELFNDWYYGHPTGDDLFCAILRAGKLDNYKCSILREFICEQ